MSIVVAERQRLQTVVDQLWERVARLEQETAEARADLSQVTDWLAAESEITDGDLARIRARFVKPRSEELVWRMARAEKLAVRIKCLPPAERRRQFEANVAALRAQAVADGTAIDDPQEAARGD